MTIIALGSQPAMDLFEQKITLLLVIWMHHSIDEKTAKKTKFTLNLVLINYSHLPSRPCTWIVTLQVCLQKHLWGLFEGTVL